MPVSLLLSFPLFLFCFLFLLFFYFSSSSFSLLLFPCLLSAADGPPESIGAGQPPSKVPGTPKLAGATLPPSLSCVVRKAQHTCRVRSSSGPGRQRKGGRPRGNKVFLERAVCHLLSAARTDVLPWPSLSCWAVLRCP